MMITDFKKGLEEAIRTSSSPRSGNTQSEADCPILVSHNGGAGLGGHFNCFPKVKASRPYRLESVLSRVDKPEADAVRNRGRRQRS